MDKNEWKWLPVTDWSALPQFEFWGATFVGEEEVDIFVESLFRDIAQKFNIPYYELKKRNLAFFLTKKILFGKFAILLTTDENFFQLKKLLIIPIPFK